MKKRYFITVNGIVQGVGFRPFIHREAKLYKFTGWCRNTGSGVELEVQGASEDISAFLCDLRDSSVIPPLAVIESITEKEIDVIAEDDFTIVESKASGHDTLIAPDLAMCDNCRKELFTLGNHRYRYPFINCTDCGPRFTIVKGVPYDRPLTSMGSFKMCKVCHSEYIDIENRRYHAQPVCCEECGPELSLVCEDREYKGDQSIREAIKRLALGDIIAIKGLGGFHLACLIDEKHAEILRERKHRNGKPFAIMVKNAEVASRLCELSEDEKRVLCGPKKPIVLLKKRVKGSYNWLSKNDTIGVMLPYTPVHELLFDTNDYDALVMTSANISDEPVVYTNDEAFSKLKMIADGFLVHNRDIVRRCDDSLVQMIDGQEVFYRRSRGYAPAPITVDFDCDGVLALGAEQKASFAFGKGNSVFYSQHIGDLKNLETFDFYTSQIDDFRKLFELKSNVYVSDLHPDFFSTRYGVEHSDHLIQVQHHHAHMASCMADNHLKDDCIGLIFDGTGLGTDNTIWGSEVLVGSYEQVERLASIKPIALPGGDIVTEEIDRVAISLLHQSGMLVQGAKGKIYRAMIDRKLNSPLSSGMGRLFDGVYSLITGESVANYEGEAAVLLECLAHQAEDEMGSYSVDWSKEDILWFNHQGMIKEIMGDKENGVDVAVIAMKFHNTIVKYACEACVNIRNERNINQVVLSGGSFFNRVLTEKIKHILEEKNFNVYTHHRVSPGDEGIAMGQLAVAVHQMNR